MYKILIVDDEVNHRRGLLKLLYTFYPDNIFLEASDGAEALEILNLMECNIVITDIRMPEMDGLELLSRIKKKNQDIYVVILSGYGEFEYAKDALKKGASDFLMKPVDPPEITECIDKLIGIIEKKQQEKDQKNSLHERLNNSMPIYVEHLMNLLVKKEDFEKEQQLVEIFPLQQKGFLFVVEVYDLVEHELN